MFLGFSFSRTKLSTFFNKDDVVIGKTGFICKPEDPADLAEKVMHYYKSDLFKDLAGTREKIIQHAKKNHSWELTGERTFNLYKKLLQDQK